MADDDMVWVDTGLGPIVAAWSKGPNDQTQWIREPEQVPRAKFDPTYMIELDAKKLKHYRDCIEKARKNKAKMSKNST